MAPPMEELETLKSLQGQVPPGQRSIRHANQASANQATGRLGRVDARHRPLLRTARAHSSASPTQQRLPPILPPTPGTPGVHPALPGDGFATGAGARLAWAVGCLRQPDGPPRTCGRSAATDASTPAPAQLALARKAAPGAARTLPSKCQRRKRTWSLRHPGGTGDCRTRTGPIGLIWPAAEGRCARCLSTPAPAPRIRRTIGDSGGGGCG
jgi:hypothetical protein